MKRSQWVFQFGRINIAHGFNEIDKADIIFNSMKKSLVAEDRFHKYIFADPEIVEVERDKYVVGKLAKYKDADNKVVEEQAKTIGKKKLNDALIAESHFIIEPKSSIIVFRPIISRLSTNQFITKFSILLEKGYDSFFFSTKIILINEDYKLTERINNLSKIQRLTIDIHPSNPNSRDLWDTLDESLQRLNAQNLKQTVESKAPGFNRGALLNSDFYKGALMAVDGYGHAEIIGSDEKGKTIKVSSSDNPVEAIVNPSEDPANLISQIKDKLRQVISRNPPKNEDQN